MLLTLGSCNSQLVLLYGNTGYVILVDVIQRLRCLDGWSSLRVTGSVTRGHLTAGRPRTVRTPASEDAQELGQP